MFYRDGALNMSVALPLPVRLLYFFLLIQTLAALDYREPVRFFFFFFFFFCLWRMGPFTLLFMTYRPV